MSGVVTSKRARVRRVTSQLPTAIRTTTASSTITKAMPEQCTQQGALSTRSGVACVSAEEVERPAEKLRNARGDVVPLGVRPLAGAMEHDVEAGDHTEAVAGQGT